MSALALAGVVPALAQTATPPAFSREALLDIARERSRQPYQPNRIDVPRTVSQWSQEQYRQVRLRPNALIWQNEGRGTTLEPLHMGSVFQTPVNLRLVEDGAARDLALGLDAFDYGNVPPPEAPLPFTGFRAQAPLGPDNRMEDFLQFQAGTLFRALARGQNFGVFSRGLVLKIGEATGEEFPLFQNFWIERPAVGSNALVIHALMDIDSAVGLFRFSVRPGDITVCDTEVTIIPRGDLANVGIAPLAGSYFFGSADRAGIDDVRHAVHDVSGLSMWNGGREWIWRPVTNPETLQFSLFQDTNPRGFGLLQRERRFDIFNDNDARYERRPSVWVEPLNEWGPGHVQLVEIPSNDENNRNIIAFWRPKNPLIKGQEHAFAYRIYWCWSPPEKPEGAIALRTSVGRASGQNRSRRRVLVDFEGETLAEKAADITVNLNPGRGKVSAVTHRPLPDMKGLRVSFELDTDNQPAIELRMTLEQGGKPISETWLYRWTP